MEGIKMTNGKYFFTSEIFLKIDKGCTYVFS